MAYSRGESKSERSSSQAVLIDDGDFLRNLVQAAVQRNYLSAINVMRRR